jgi:hypothetical protein
MDFFLIICFIICIIFFLFYFIDINLFNLLSSSIIIDFKQLATKGNKLVTPNRYSINYINNNYLITENGILYIDTSTSLVYLNFPFSNYTYDINTNFNILVPIIKGLKEINN